MNSSEAIRWPQYLAGFASAMGAFSIGAGLGWSGPLGTRLDQLNFPLNTNEFGWIASILTLGCSISCIPIGFLMDRFGRKWSMISLSVPFLVGWCLVIWAQNFTMLLIGRLLIGIAGGAFCISAPQYSAEISDANIICLRNRSFCFILYFDFSLRCTSHSVCYIFPVYARKSAIFDREKSN